MPPAAKTAPHFRPPPKRLGAIRRASLAGIERYSQFVRVMKRALPAAAAGLALAVLAYALQPRETGHFAITSDNLSQLEHDRTMVHPRLFGTDDSGAPFEVTAETAVQDGPSALRVRLNTVRAQMTMKDGLWVRLEGQHGLINSETHQLDFADGVRVTADGGYEAHSAAAHFDLTSGIVSGHSAGVGPRALRHVHCARLRGAQGTAPARLHRRRRHAAARGDRTAEARTGRTTAMNRWGAALAIVLLCGGAAAQTRPRPPNPPGRCNSIRRSPFR